MRVLLDEQMPRDLVAELTGHDVRTVGEMGWKGLDNGELLARAAERFDVLLSMDKSMPAQQDISSQRVGLILIRAVSNRIEALRPLIPAVQAAGPSATRPGATGWRLTCKCSWPACTSFKEAVGLCFCQHQCAFDIHALARTSPAADLQNRYAARGPSCA